MCKQKLLVKALSTLIVILLAVAPLTLIASAESALTTSGSYIANIAKGKPATASSYETADKAPSFGNDGSTSSLWVADNGNIGNWWMVDLESVRSIYGSEIEFEFEGDIWEYVIETSIDGNSWSTEIDKTSNTSSSKVQTDLYTTTARYIRVTITGVPGSRWTAFCEFRVWGEEIIEITGNNVALQKNATASSQENASRAPSNIVDGDPSSLWIASNGNAGNWVQLDLGGRYVLNAVRLTFEDGNRVWRYKIQTSLNNIDWITVVDNTQNSFAVQMQAYPVSITAQYIRVNFEEAPGAAWTALGELEAFGTIGEDAGTSEKILVIVPHEDDEALIAAGIIHSAILEGDTVKVAIATNGDCNGYDQTLGINRLNESISALEVLGLSKTNITAFGYADTGGLEGWTRTTDSFLYRLYHTASETEVLSSNWGNTQTYGIAGILEDYHYQMTNTHANYTRENLINDLTNYIEGYKPDKIYTTSAYDLHGDHAYINIYVTDILRGIVEEDPNYAPVLYESIVHSTQYDVLWPVVDANPLQPSEFTAPENLAGTPLRWEERISVPIPADMLDGTNLKNTCLATYTSQYSSYIGSFAKANEIFWAKDFSNLAYRAIISASSETAGAPAAYAVDGVVGGYLELPDRDWVPNGNAVGAWIQMNWAEGQTIHKIILHDKPNADGAITGGTLVFSDGTSISVSALPSDGKSMAIDVNLSNITWVRFVINSVSGDDIGLSEIEVF